MKSVKRIKALLLAVFAVMMLPVTVNATASGLRQDLNNGPVTVEFFTVEDETFEEGYIYPMTFTAPESGWYNVTADGAMGLVLGYSEYDDASYEGEFSTYTNDTVTFSEPVLAYKDDPYRAGAVCDLVYLDKDEEWTFSIIGKYFGSSIAKAAKFQVNLIRKVPKITGVSVNESAVKPGDTVVYSIGFDQNMEPWGFSNIDLSEYVYGPNGEDIFSMSSYHRDYEFNIAGRTITYSYSVTENDNNKVLKVDYISLYSSDNGIELTYANDTYRAWNGHNIFFDAGYIPGIPAVKFVTGKCYHTVLPGWLYTAVQDGKEYELCELCDYKKLLRTVAPAPCTHSWNSGTVTKAATTQSTGIKTFTCIVCGMTKTESIPKIQETITIAKNPINQKPVATKNKITIKWKHLKHTSKSGKSIWKKIKKVQVQCATDKTFKNIVKNMMTGKGRTKAAIKGLQKNTTYFVRVRYFDGTGYSKWSRVKKVKTKK